MCLIFDSFKLSGDPILPFDPFNKVNDSGPQGPLVVYLVLMTMLYLFPPFRVLEQYVEIFYFFFIICKILKSEILIILQPGDFHEVFPKDKDGKVPFGSENLLETYKVTCN